MEQIQSDVGDFLVEQILLSVGKGKSPVSGESFKSLSKDYKDKKIKLGASPIPNLELTGEMLNSLTYRTTSDGIEIGFFDDQAWKADGHLKFSGEKNGTPKRRFLPDVGQSFKKDIDKEINKIIQERLSEWQG